MNQHFSYADHTSSKACSKARVHLKQQPYKSHSVIAFHSNLRSAALGINFNDGKFGICRQNSLDDLICLSWLTAIAQSKTAVHSHYTKASLLVTVTTHSKTAGQHAVSESVYECAGLGAAGAGKGELRQGQGAAGEGLPDGSLACTHLASLGCPRVPCWQHRDCPCALPRGASSVSMTPIILVMPHQEPPAMSHALYTVAVYRSHCRSL